MTSLARARMRARAHARNIRKIKTNRKNKPIPLKISTLKRYLKGEIVFENFLEIVGIKEVKVGAIVELLELSAAAAQPKPTINKTIVANRNLFMVFIFSPLLLLFTNILI